MFKINIYLRFALIALFLVGGTLLATLYSFWYALPFLILGIALLVGYILLGTVQTAAELVQQGRLDEAEERLNMTWKPNWLFVYNRGYYYMLKATIAMQRQDMDTAEKFLLQAQEIGLPSDNEKATVAFYLAAIYANRERWNVAQNYLKKAKDYNITMPELKEQIKQFEQQILQNRGQIKLARQMQMQRGGAMQWGSKRKRPKMR